MYSTAQPTELSSRQKTCPVCGGQIGAHGPVQTVPTLAHDSPRPSLFRRAFSWVPGVQKPNPPIYIPVCSPECAAKVKDDPGTYLYRTIAIRSGWKQ